MSLMENLLGRTLIQPDDTWAAGQIHAPDLEHGGQLLLGQVQPLPDRPQPRAKTLLTGVSMLLCSSLIASLGMENTTEWHTELGRYWQTVSNMGLLPVLIIGAVLLTAGVILSLWGAFSKSDNKSI